jgi:uncharacterized protein involved in outer membrane biogenesis
VIKFVFRWAFRLLILTIVLVVALILLKDTIARSVVERRIQAETGFDVKIGKLQFGLLTPYVSVEDFVLYNPAEFGGGPFLNIPEMHLEYSPLGLRQMRLKLLRLNLKELNIVENMAGRTNIVELLARTSPESLRQSHSTNETEFGGVDMLNLSIGKVRYVDMRRPRRNQEINLNIRNEIVQNVRSQKDLAGLFFKILLRAGITIYLDQPRPVVMEAPRHPSVAIQPR